MTINQFRGLLYRSAKYLGDVQAVEKAAKTGSVKPLERRLERRLVGKALGRGMGRLFR